MVQSNRLCFLFRHRHMLYYSKYQFFSHRHIHSQSTYLSCRSSSLWLNLHHSILWRWRRRRWWWWHPNIHSHCHKAGNWTGSCHFNPNRYHLWNQWKLLYLLILWRFHHHSTCYSTVKLTSRIMVRLYNPCYQYLYYHQPIFQQIHHHYIRPRGRYNNGH